MEMENGLEMQKQENLDKEINQLLNSLGKKKEDLQGLVGDYIDRNQGVELGEDT